MERSSELGWHSSVGTTGAQSSTRRTFGLAALRSGSTMDWSERVDTANSRFREGGPKPNLNMYLKITLPNRMPSCSPIGTATNETSRKFAIPAETAAFRTNSAKAEYALVYNAAMTKLECHVCRWLRTTLLNGFLVFFSFEIAATSRSSSPRQRRPRSHGPRPRSHGPRPRSHGPRSHRRRPSPCS